MGAPAGSEDAAPPDTPADALAPDGSLDAGSEEADALIESAVDAPSDVSMDVDSDGPDAAEPDSGQPDAEDDAAFFDGSDDGDATSDAGDAGVESICYFGDFDVDQLQEVACIAWPGAIRTKLDLQGMTGGYSIDSIARRPDGRSIAVAGRLSASAPARLVVFPLDQGALPIVVATAPAADRTITHPAFSTDGLTLAFLADFDLAGAMGLYVVSAGGGAPRRLSPAPSNPAFDVTDFAWSAGAGSRTWLAYVGDLEQDGVSALWAADTASAPISPVPIVATAALAPDRDVQPGLQWDRSDRIYYRTNLLDSHVWRVQSSDRTATDQRVVTELVNANGPASTYAFGVSGAGDRLAFSADGPTTGALQVFVAPIMTTATSPQQVSSGAALPGSTGVVGPAFGLPIRWSASGTTIACASDWPLAPGNLGDVFSAWTLSPEGTTHGTRVLGMPQSVDQNVREVSFSQTGDRLIVRGDLVTEGAFELYSTDDLQTAGQDPLARRLEEVPAGGDVLGLEETP